MSLLNTPVALFIFNRPDLTAQVFSAIAAQKPSKLLIIADGPRINRPTEAEKCAKTRDIINKIDWKCEVLTNFSDTNMGCRNRITSGLNWVFENVEEAIILEDDCVPAPTFFQFCEELLQKYRNDERVFQICGANFQDGIERGNYSYYFSKLNYIWGWATWRRAWKNHDVDMKLWPEVKLAGLLMGAGDSRFVDFWQQRFQDVYDRKVDTWDYQWVFTSWINGGLSIVPNVNLIKNIGFGPEATHTQDVSDKRSNSVVGNVSFPMKHLPYVVHNWNADSYDMECRYAPPLSIVQKIKYLFIFCIKKFF